MSGAVLVFVEHVGGEPDRLSLEALALGRERRRARSARRSTRSCSAPAAEARRGEARHVTAWVSRTCAEDARLDDYAPAAWGAAIRAVVAARSPAAVIAAGSERGNEVLAHVAARAGVPMAANVVEVDARRFVAARPPALGGQPPRGRGARRARPAR